MDPSNIDPEYSGSESDAQPTSEAMSLSIKLGDFIKVIAPTQQEIHDHVLSLIHI